MPTRSEKNGEINDFTLLGNVIKDHAEYCIRLFKKKEKFGTDNDHVITPNLHIVVRIL